MNDTLKVAGRIGAELGAAKAENEKLREALRWYEEKVTECRKIGSLGDNARQALDLDGGFRARDAISKQSEPTDTYTAVEMATAAAQGFRDGQAAVEPAPAQDDGRSAFQAYLNECAAYDFVPSIAGAFHFAWQASPGQPIRMPPSPYTLDVEPESMTDYERGEAQGRCDMWAMVKELNAARPAQTEQQPVAWECRCTCDECTGADWTYCSFEQYQMALADPDMEARELYAAPVSQAEQQPVGWKLVPVVPTQGMIDAAMAGAGCDLPYPDAYDAITASIAAAPIAQASPRPTGLSQGWNLVRQCDGFVIGHSSDEPKERHKAQALLDGRIYVPFLVAQTAPQPAQINIVPLLSAGAALSNIAFNLAQRPGATLDQHVCDLLSSSRKHWDEARAALSTQRGES